MLILTPTRGRPENARRLLDAFVATKSLDSTSLIFCLDEDDDKLPEYTAVFRDEKYDDCAWFGFALGQRMRLGPTLNHYATCYAPTYDMIGFMGDDHCPRTYGWDERFHNVLEGVGTGVVYGNDLIQGERLCTEMVMSTNIITKLGYMVPPGLVHLFIDNAWYALGRATTLTYVDDVIIEHVHPCAGVVAWDDLYAEVNSSVQWTADEAAFKTWERDELPRVYELLRSL